MLDKGGKYASEINEQTVAVAVKQAYARLYYHTLAGLRSGEYQYPESKKMVGVVLDVYLDADIPNKDLPTNEELERLSRSDLSHLVR